jgi:predicted dehydrogenase
LVLAALKAGKHVYCEAPLAHTIDDARIIAQAAVAAKDLVFHSGLQQRNNPQHLHVFKFVRTGALGDIATCRAYYHKRTSWLRKAATDERESAINWRLNPKLSLGLAGEIGVHQFDVASWFLKSLPTAVYGAGSIRDKKAGPDVYDTVQALMEFPNGINLSYDATLVNSFEGAAETYLGTQAGILIRDYRAWMFKQYDSIAKGWETYAFKEKVGEDIGIALVANASKILDDDKEPSENREIDPKRTALVTSAEAFMEAIRGKTPSACDALTGFRATVIAITANQAIIDHKRIAFQPEWFAL